MIKKASVAVLLSMMMFLFMAASSHCQADAADELPVKGMVTMIDLGATQCIPCKLMAPIIEEVRKEYKGKAAIVFVDVWKNKAPALKFQIRVIPTQIFFDKNGKEFVRHEGFMDKKTMISILEKLGVKPG